MDWTIAVAALTSALSLAVAGACALWSAGAALPEGRRGGLARQIARTAGATSAPSPMMLRGLAAVFAVAAILPWGLAAPPEIGDWRFAFPALGAAFFVVFFLHGVSAGAIRQGAAFAQNDRRVFAPLSLALAAGYAALLGAWFTSGG
jgi:hypothetical protein